MDDVTRRDIDRWNTALTSTIARHGMIAETLYREQAVPRLIALVDVWDVLLRDVEQILTFDPRYYGEGCLLERIRAARALLEGEEE